MIDNKFTKQIQDWLNAMPQDQDIVKGATLLLQCNRNKVLYNNIVRNPEKLKEKLIYELRKHLAYRLDGLTLQQVAVMDKKVTSEVARTIAKAQKAAETPLKGQRADHNQLPADVQNLFFEAHDIMVSMRSLHEKLKLMSADKPCERYTHLKELLALHDRYRKCYNTYDGYDTAEAKADGNQPTESKENAADPDELAKAIGTYRGYIVTNIDKLADFVANGKTSKADRLREKMQSRFDECKRLNVNFEAETLERLKALGIS